MQAIKGRYEQSGRLVHLLQWMGITLLLTVIVLFLFAFFPDKQSTTALMLLQAMQAVAVFVLPPMLVAYLWSKQPLEWLSLSTPAPSFAIAAAVLLMIVAMPAINMLADWNSRLTLPSSLHSLEAWMRQMEDQATMLTERFLLTASWSGLIVNILILALLPAIGEELTFRGVLLRLFSPFSSRMPHAAIWAVAALFSAMHGQFYGFLPRMLIGALLAYMLCLTGSMRVPIVMHFTNNALAVLTAFVCTRMHLEWHSLETVGTGSTAWLGYVSMVLTAAGIYLFFRFYRQKGNDQLRS